MYIAGCLFVFISTILTACVAEEELVLVQALWTNGQRNPDYLCKKDSNSGSDAWLQGPRALSKLGMIEQHQLGEQIYNFYAVNQSFLSKNYDSKQIYFRSSDQPAAIASAYANLVGMYYGRAEHTPDNDYPSNAPWPQGFVPVPVHVAEPTTDYELNGEASCFTYDVSMQSLPDTPAYKNIASKAEDTLSAVSAVCGEKIELMDIWKVEEASIAENRENRQNLFNTSTQTQIRDLFVQFDALRHSRAVSALKGGNLFWRVMQQMDSKIKCVNTSADECNWMSPLKYYAYSTDSLMMRSLLSFSKINSSLLQRTYDQRSDSAVAIFELWRVNGQYSFQMKFQTDFSQPFDTVTQYVAGCPDNNGYCPLDNLRQAVNDTRLPGQDTEEACRPRTTLGKVENAKSSEGLANRVKRKLVDDSNDTLVFVQAVWRHGDRSPVAGFVCKKDPNKDSDWKQGFDQLSFNGMRQHMKFGNLIYERYVNKLKYLRSKYLSSEVYIRSTDYNRTIISAISNLIGTFYNKGVQAGVDYPNTTEVQRWPAGYVPIPIHTIFRSNDPYADVPYTACARKPWLQNIAFNSPEVRLITDANQELFSVISNICGQNVSLINVNGPVDTWLVEQNYNKPQLFDVNLFNELKGLDSYAEKLKAGFLDSPYLQNMDLSIELPKIRGGPVLQHLLDNMDDKIACQQAGGDYCNKLLSNKKYYVYSSHDITLNALFSALGCMDKIVHAGIPNYSAGVLFELWKTKTGTHYDYYVKVLYHRGEYEVELEDITDSLPGCPAGGKCPYNVIKERAKAYVLTLDEFSTLCKNTQIPTPTTAAPASSMSVTTSNDAAGIKLSVSVLFLVMLLCRLL